MKPDDLELIATCWRIDGVKNNKDWPQGIWGESETLHYTSERMTLHKALQQMQLVSKITDSKVIQSIPLKVSHVVYPIATKR